MANPVRLTEKTIPDLQQIVNDFPFFHAARMLYLKKLSVTGDIRLQLELKKMAIHIPDRVKLYKLIENEQPITPAIDQITATIDNKESIKNTETAIPDADDLPNALAGEPLTFETASLASTDYTRLLEDNNSKPAVSQPGMRRQDLIDSFIRNEQTRTHSRILIDPDKTGIDSDEIIKDQDNSPKTSEDAYFTETLANIYIKQKRYDKALEIIKRLSLKYPKKNIYFADQIRYLEKLIIHTKK
jgi:tetratricopeptide (TPR) repeat protein